MAIQIVSTEQEIVMRNWIRIGAGQRSSKHTWRDVGEVDPNCMKLHTCPHGVEEHFGVPHDVLDIIGVAYEVDSQLHAY
jgi:hypothetical protein